MTSKELRSAQRYQGPDRAFARAWWYGTGRTTDEIDRPLIGIANAWNEIANENVHLDRVAKRVKDGVIAAGGTPMEFNVIHATDVLSEASEGMKYVLPARETIADSIELMVESHGFDAVVLIAGGDKVTPGMLMGALRIDLPTIYVYTGTTEVGRHHDQAVSWETVFEAIGRFHDGKIDERELEQLTLAQMPSSGGGASAYTGNTMALVAEAMGLGLPGSGTVVAGCAEHLRLAYNSGVKAMDLLKENTRISSIVTPGALRNAARLALSVCGSTNLSLHLPAVAHEAGFSFSWDEFDQLASDTPTLVKLRPSGDVSLPDFHRAGGVQATLNVLQPTLEDAPIRVAPRSDRTSEDSQVILPLASPHSATGGLRVLRGSLSPEGAIVKMGGVPEALLRHRGPARVFENEEDAIIAIHDGQIKPGDVVVIRNEGPKGGPGFREMLGATAAIVGMGLAETVALVTDGRFSGASHGAAIGYVCPEAAADGPIGYVEDGDTIVLDLENGRLEVEVDSDTLFSRARREQAEGPTRGVLARYARSVSSAAQGAVLV